MVNIVAFDNSTHDYTIASAGGSLEIDDRIYVIAGDHIVSADVVLTGNSKLQVASGNSLTISAGTLTLGHTTDTLVDTGAVAVTGGTLALGANSDTVGVAKFFPKIRQSLHAGFSRKIHIQQDHLRLNPTRSQRNLHRSILPRHCQVARLRNSGGHQLPIRRIVFQNHNRG